MGSFTNDTYAQEGIVATTTAPNCEVLWVGPALILKEANVFKVRVPFCLFALTLGVTLHGASGDNVHRVDLVVGNAIYQNGVALCNAVNDARDMHKALQEAGFDGEVVENANRQAFQSAFKRFIKEIRPGDIATFYYAGEGVQIRGE